ncbi:FAD:protein FMN transferase [Microbacterium sp. 4R-513]|uniref:FAD:protein FMN transferase n=1 Tax=Microbacterium sp. 4R-513 TaxID=2567934 RepID=UPI0013E1357E|nr:FAD:protein FMN transferase [Microbacterium sp. 4R-513]QIG40858.1 FAD:protein FMN transferase [Microbacterium sp. 4R-513]
MTTLTHPHRRTWTHEVMGSVATVRLVFDRPQNSAGEASVAVAACFAELDTIDALFSPYRVDSEISRIRRGETTITDAHALVRVVADACREAAMATDGRFDAWLGGSFDPTGLVKGWAVERAAGTHLGDLLGRDGCLAAGLSVGGDMQLLTAEGADWTWHVGIADPSHPGEIVATLDIPRGAVATSGTAERGDHVLDPRTGRPAVGTVASATVVADRLTWADVWATTAVVAGFDDLSWITGAGTTTGLLVAPGGRTRRWLGATEVAVETAGAGIPD